MHAGWTSVRCYPASAPRPVRFPPSPALHDVPSTGAYRPDSPPLPVDATHVASGRRRAAAVLLVWALVSWCLVPHGIGSSWRECDTQTIARNFVLEDFDVTRPRVDWRGTTDGAVECEFPLYQLVVGAALTVAGIDAEWPGRLLSLLSMAFGAFALHRLLERRAGPDGALAGLGVFLVTGSAVMLGARVMPDATSFAFGMW